MHKSLRTLTLSAMLTAMSVVIGMFCKTFLSFGGGLVRITFENLPVIFSGIIFGPLTGAVVGACSDLVSYLLSPQIYPPNLIVTLGAASVGFISGLVSRFVIKKQGYAQIITAASSAHIIGSMIIKTIGLFQFYQWAVLWRIPLYIVISTLEILIMCLLYKTAAIRRLLGESVRTTKRNGENE